VAIRDLTATVGAVKSTVDNSEAILKDLGAWKPQIDNTLSEVRSDINVLRQQLGRVALNPILNIDPASLRERGALPPLEGAGRDLNTGDNGRGPGGHRGVHQHRGLSVEGDLALPTPPAIGTSSKLDRLYAPSNLVGGQHRGSNCSSGPHLPRPTINFPCFDGEKPKSWKRQCESYFRMFNISPEFWVDTATMHFTGGATLWLENCRILVEQMSWVDLCLRVCQSAGVSAVWQGRVSEVAAATIPSETSGFGR
jgi:hypothetical protein